ncbi:MAG: flavodoxin domain-containing protein, partial [Planctomycetota bacterium]
HHIHDRLAEHGHEASVVDVVAARPGHDPRSFDATIVAASIHFATFARPLLRWVTDNREGLAAGPSAFVSISLTAAGGTEQDRKDLAKVVEAFVGKTGWKPAVVHHVAGALAYTRYGFIKRWLMKRIARQRGGPTDTSRDHALTDWDDLTQFVHRFIAGLAPGPVTPETATRHATANAGSPAEARS